MLSLWKHYYLMSLRKRNVEAVDPDEYSDEEELEEAIDFWRYTPKNIFCCIDYQQCESQHLINKSI